MDFVYFPSNHSSAWLVWDARCLVKEFFLDFLPLKVIQKHPKYKNIDNTKSSSRSLDRVASVHLPQRVPYGVHGLWLDKQFLDLQDSKRTFSKMK